MADNIVSAANNAFKLITEERNACCAHDILFNNLLQTSHIFQFKDTTAFHLIDGS